MPVTMTKEEYRLLVLNAQAQLDEDRREQSKALRSEIEQARANKDASRLFELALEFDGTHFDYHAAAALRSAAIIERRLA